MRTIAIAIAGTRGHYAAILRELTDLPELRIVALHAASDPLDPLTAWCAKHGHRPEIYAEYEAMLDDARPDVVVVCGPFESHALMSVAAIRRDIHVLTEKPAALTSDQLAALRQACAEHPRVHLAGMMFSRYAPGFLAARQLIDQGAIGDVRLINARKSYKLGTRPPHYRDRPTYGGTIPWVGSHAIDWVQHLTANRKFETVYAAHSPDANGGNGTMESSALCHFTLAGGVFASVSIDYLRPAAAPTHGDDWARVVGTHGIMEIRPDSLHLIDSAGGRDVPLAVGRTLLRDFLDHIDGQSPSLIDANSTIALTDACLRALRSADERRIISFD